MGCALHPLSTNEQPKACCSVRTLAECNSTSVHRTKVWSASEWATPARGLRATLLFRFQYQNTDHGSAGPCTWGRAAVQLREPVQPKQAVAVRRRAVVPAADEDAALRGQEAQLPNSPVALLEVPPTYASWPSASLFRHPTTRGSDTQRPCKQTKRQSCHHKHQVMAAPGTGHRRSAPQTWCPAPTPHPAEPQPPATCPPCTLLQ
jgi:hypothetical protein